MTKEAFSHYAKNLRECAIVYLISVQCDVNEAERREKKRGNRWLGQSRGFLPAYDNVPFYDLTLDTTHTLPQENAKFILDFIHHTPASEAF